MHLQTCLLPGQFLNWSLSARVYPSYSRGSWGQMANTRSCCCNRGLKTGQLEPLGLGDTETVQKRPRS